MGLDLDRFFVTVAFIESLVPCARSALSPVEILQHFLVRVQQSQARDQLLIANIFSFRVQFNVILRYGAANQGNRSK